MHTTPVFSEMVKEVELLILTNWGLPVKKSRIQLQREVLKPNRLNFVVSCCGMTMLNAELKSMNSILS